MKRRIFSGFLAFFCLLAGCGFRDTGTTQATNPVTQPTEPPRWTVVTTPDPTQEAPAESFSISFAGDCTFGDNVNSQTPFGTFCTTVRDNYEYPLANVKDILLADDLTLVNLECALTESDPTEEEMEELEENLFRFRGPAEYAKILSLSGVEFASCANNHSKDFGKQGLYDTYDALKAENISYASFSNSSVVTTESGLKVGIFAVFFNITNKSLENQVKFLTEKGAELIIMSVHWGDEGKYIQNQTQIDLGRRAIDAGVHIVYGHHSHTLQPIEAYNGGIIYYSLGNFSFGGNRYPKDADTAILQQEILRYADGRIALGSLTVLPCSITSTEKYNDYQPRLYGTNEEGYYRVFSKLEGSYEGDDVYVPYLEDPTEPQN